jgi:hypothetical protein
MQSVLIPQMVTVGKHYPLKSLGRNLSHELHRPDAASAGVLRGVCVHFDTHGNRINRFGSPTDRKQR